jgi:hypothetical protein
VWLKTQNPVSFCKQSSRHDLTNAPVKNPDNGLRGTSSCSPWGIPLLLLLSFPYDEYLDQHDLYVWNMPSLGILCFDNGLSSKEEMTYETREDKPRILKMQSHERFLLLAYATRRLIIASFSSLAGLFARSGDWIEKSFSTHWLATISNAEESPTYRWKREKVNGGRSAKEFFQLQLLSNVFGSSLSI